MNKLFAICVMAGITTIAYFVGKQDGYHEGWRENEKKYETRVTPKDLAEADKVALEPFAEDFDESSIGE